MGGGASQETKPKPVEEPKPVSVTQIKPSNPLAAKQTASHIEFDPSIVTNNLERFWALQSQFGAEESPAHFYLNEIVSDRYSLLYRLQIIRDELQLAVGRFKEQDIGACAADLTIPSVMTTVAKTNCGDRVHQGEATTTYKQLVASRFATMSELGDFKLESFSPIGGGCDDGPTLAHVTVAHNMDASLRNNLYNGNPSSCHFAGFDIQTHTGRYEGENAQPVFGKTAESRFRECRAACGAIVGTLAHFSADNVSHVRLRRDLGEENFKHLTQAPLLSKEGIDITMVVAAAIISVRGMQNAAKALLTELDSRGLAHLTASTTVNVASKESPIIYLARVTVFGNAITTQGFGTDAAKYAGSLREHKGGKRLVLTYAGLEAGSHPITREQFDKPQEAHH